ncbi:efflux RND transporter periplasmic adaptor subunit [Flavobacterium sediminis]|uniref:Efflux RND transporter periplasmic adaptor subunit n=1 Tax=Flavobacterium sediminis TaxID=2201181 RepID=A0A2U8QTK7_9FLAO|nr:efflux RND transporter periplasmic adaptor subunit [Flavobacterium sediminis]AWM13503.1 efflux RND transporter periplasmic adaptor subunit [Flavobacterium sediminis]
MKKKFVSAVVFVSVLFVSCKKEQQQQAKPVMPYKVVQIAKTNTTLQAEYPATLEGVMDIDIRPKVDGYIQKIFVDEGQEVKKGQVLFKLETQSVSQDAAAAKAKVDAAQVEVDRLVPLVERNIISKVQLETAKANLASAKSTYQSVIANIGYATITSPVNGVVGTIPYRLGTYVNSQTDQPLTRVSDITKVYAYFSVSEKQQLDMVMNSEGKTFQDKIAKMPAVSLILSNGIEYSQKGKVETFSGLANPETGSFNVRAGFPNPEKILRSGGTGTVTIPTDLKDVILIPQSATMEMQDKTIALVVDKENKVKMVPVEVRPVPGGKFFVVDKGLNVNDKVLIEGVGLITEGTPIKPEVVPLNDILNPTEK